MHYHLLVSSFDEFVHSTVGVCGLEMLGRIDIDTKEIQRHRLVPECNSVKNESYIHSHLFAI